MSRWDGGADSGAAAAHAFVQRIQVDRILPPEERTPGRERVLIDVGLERLQSDVEPFQLEDGDEVRVFGISDQRRNRITIRGRVFRPGVYEYRPGMSVWDLMQRAEGLLPEAYPVVAHVFRIDPDDRTLNLHRVSLGRDAAGEPVDDLELMDLHEVVRIEAGVERTDTLARSYRVALGDALPTDLASRSAATFCGGARSGCRRWSRGPPS